MFRRLFEDDGLLLIPALSLALVVGAFAVFVARALLARRGAVDHAARLPLADDERPAPRP